MPRRATARSTRQARRAGKRRRGLVTLFLGLVAAAGAAATVVAVLNGDRAGVPASGAPQAPRTERASAAHEVRTRPPGPIPGDLLIADRGNNRILLVDSTGRILWRYPPPGGAGYPFTFDDDTFFTPGFRSIISNQEDQDTLQLIGFPDGRVLWHYGHVNVRGSAPGYLNTPDDAYLLPDGLVSVADAYNCRVLFIRLDGRIARSLGRAGSCTHDPPRTLGAINGATPLPDGGTLVSEIGGSWIDAFSRTGRLLWDFQAPVGYPSDPQLLPSGNILLADYSKPGAVLILNRHGRVLWRYAPRSGNAMLDHPSLALPLRPGLIAVNDDYRDRVVLIDIRTHRIVWQYGHTDRPGTAPGFLNTPDGLDLLPVTQAEAFARTLAAARHAARTATRRRLVLRAAPYRLPDPVERAVAVTQQGRILIAGGLDASGVSATGVFSLQPASGKLSSLGALPLPVHDAAGALIGGRLFVFGGGSTISIDAVQRFDPRTGRGTVVAHLPRPLSDLAAAQLGGSTYLVGGYDGARPRREILATRTGRSFTVAGRLPVGLRYAAVAVSGNRILIAGGVSESGTSSNVYVFTPSSGRTTLLAHLPAPVAHAAAVAIGAHLYVIGGSDAGGRSVNGVDVVDTATHSARFVRTTAPPAADAAAAHVGAVTYLIGGDRGSQPVASVLEVSG